MNWLTASVGDVVKFIVHVIQGLGLTKGHTVYLLVA